MQPTPVHFRRSASPVWVTAALGLLFLSTVLAVVPAWANQPSVAVDDCSFTDPGTHLVVDVVANDFDPDGDSIRLVTDPLRFNPPTPPDPATQGVFSVVSPFNRELRFDPVAGFEGVVAVDYVIGDGNGVANRSRATWTVEVGNQKPVAVDDSVTAAPGMTVTLDVVANDFDPVCDTVRLVTDPVRNAPHPTLEGTVTPLYPNHLVFEPAPGFAGRVEFDYVIGDQRGQRDTGKVVIDYGGGAANLPPTAADDQATTAPGQSVDVDVVANDSDPNGDPIALVGMPIWDQADHGVCQRVDGSRVRYSPHMGFSGTDSCGYEIADSSGATARARLQVTVTAGGSPQIAVFAPGDAAVAAGSTVDLGRVNVNNLVWTFKVRNVGGGTLVVDSSGTRVGDSDWTVESVPGPLAHDQAGDIVLSRTVPSGPNKDFEETVSVSIESNATNLSRFEFLVEVEGEDCNQPDDLLEELAPIIQGQLLPEVCGYKGKLKKNYGPWAGGGSQNIPIVAAVIALYDDPDYAMGNMENWATWMGEFLAGQLRSPHQPQLPRKAQFFHGTEAFSYNYDAPVLVSVLAARLWAKRNPTVLGASTLEERARNYLRSTLLIYGFAAAADSAAYGEIYRSDGQVRERLQVNTRGQSNYTGPYITLAGSRSPPNFWGHDGRGPLFSRAAGIGFLVRWEEPTHQLISSAAQNELGSCNSAGGNAYGFNCDEQRQLRELRDLNQIPDAGLLSQLDSIRTETTFYIMGWGGLGNDNLGRASFMVHNNNCDKQPPVLGVAYFPTSLQSPSQGDAHILYPYTGNRSCTGVGESSAGVDPAGSPKLWARRLGSAPRVEAVLPSTPPAFYLKLSDNAPPQLVYGAWPPATSSDGADQEEVP